jgi:hypothetical protein
VTPGEKAQHRTAIGARYSDLLLRQITRLGNYRVNVVGPSRPSRFTVRRRTRHCYGISPLMVSRVRLFGVLVCAAFTKAPLRRKARTADLGPSTPDPFLGQNARSQQRLGRLHARLGHSDHSGVRCRPQFDQGGRRVDACAPQNVEQGICEVLPFTGHNFLLAVFCSLARRPGRGCSGRCRASRY